MVGVGDGVPPAVGGIDPLLDLKDIIIHLPLSSSLSSILQVGRHISIDGNLSAKLSDFGIG